MSNGQQFNIISPSFDPQQTQNRLLGKSCTAEEYFVLYTKTPIPPKISTLYYEYDEKEYREQGRAKMGWII